jgi:hypothetical protein
MKSVLCCFLLFAPGLWAQSAAKFDADLTALTNPGASRNAVAQQVTTDILALADKDAQPSRQTVSDFADELTKALAGKGLTSEKVKPVTQAILDVLESSSATSYRFHATIDSFRDALIALNVTAVQAKSAANRLFILGQEIRGPEDIKNNNLNLLRSK